ncbi:hypothetical protein M9Y10_002806 [Tritrichomonas musculus]|uniref:Helicase superfamily 3 single-stranded DNA/RNA virus domain-containing protein n=2 Tax=Tritrichomonas musculus TaxID=1915356 RepID=A0ABR2LAZ0_9EUKA
MPSKGTEEQNYKYCSKSGDFVEIGQKVKSLEEKIKRDDKWKKMKDDYLNLSVEDFSNKYPRESVIYRNQLKNWATDLAISNNTWPGLLPEKNFWIWGAPGVGKSRWARSQCEPEFIFPKGICKWWNGYNPLIHKCIILEDFPSDGKFLAYYMKIWMDRYNFIGECKGSQIQVSPANWVFIVTSNFKIRDIFDPDDAEAIERRCSEIEFKSGSLFQATRIDFKKILKI